MKFKYIDGELYILARVDDVPDLKPSVVIDLETKEKCDVLMGLSC